MGGLTAKRNKEKQRKREMDRERRRERKNERERIINAVHLVSCSQCKGMEH